LRRAAEIRLAISLHPTKIVASTPLTEEAEATPANGVIRFFVIRYY
jgi:hypothetical protein